VIGNREILDEGPVAKRAGEPALADAAWPDHEQVLARPNPVAGRQFQKLRAVEAARRQVLDILIVRSKAQPGGAGAVFEPLLLAQLLFLFEEQGQPLRMIEAARPRLRFKLLKTLGHAVQAETDQKVERRLGRHRASSLRPVDANTNRALARLPLRKEIPITNLPFNPNKQPPVEAEKNESPAPMTLRPRQAENCAKLLTLGGSRALSTK
jgi:hypothetical protein